MKIFERVKKFNLPKGKYAIFGSALLDVWGLRSASDLDIIVTPELFEQLKNKGWEEKQGNGFIILTKEDANVTTVQNKPTDGNYNPDRLQLIREATVINGIPFVRVEEVIACKTAYNRPKDLRDIKLLKDYLA
ncbi:MAG: hypothetical protein AAB656_04100 [Patescibacteria group bacterium]